MPPVDYLAPSWDSYSGAPLKRDAVTFASHLLQQITSDQTPAPHVCPTALGGIQIEWHEKGINLELHVTGAFECEVWFQDLLAPEAEPFTRQITNDLAVLKMPLHLLNTRPS